jgi:hypothetical protein
MTITIPRAEIQAVAAKHKVDYDLDFDPPAEWVRATVAFLRAGVDFNGTPTPEVLAEADDLDALVDRYEREASL